MTPSFESTQHIHHWGITKNLPCNETVQIECCGMSATKTLVERGRSSEKTPTDARLSLLAASSLVGLLLHPNLRFENLKVETQATISTKTLVVHHLLSRLFLSCRLCVKGAQPFKMDYTMNGQENEHGPKITIREVCVVAILLPGDY
jgi:hypothetical protein